MSSMVPVVPKKTSGASDFLLIPTGMATKAPNTEKTHVPKALQRKNFSNHLGTTHVIHDVNITSKKECPATEEPSICISLCIRYRNAVCIMHSSMWKSEDVAYIRFKFQFVTHYMNTSSVIELGCHHNWCLPTFFDVIHLKHTYITMMLYCSYIQLVICLNNAISQQRYCQMPTMSIAYKIIAVTETSLWAPSYLFKFLIFQDEA